MKKKILSLLLVSIMVVISCIPAMATKSSDNSEIEQVLNDFFETKEMNFASSEDISLNNFFTTSTRETLTTKTFYKLFLFEKQVRLENDPDILNETFDVEINDIAVDNNSAKVTAYEYYEYELSYADGEKSSRGTTYAIELERENGEWRINNISTNSELEELVADTSDVQMLFEDESTPVSDPDIERAHQQAEVLAEQADVERTERAAYTFHGYSGLKALKYALEYTNSTSNLDDTSAYNDLFKSYNPNDCQNFVSQCVWAGLGGENTSSAIENKKAPMITASGREWWATSKTCCDNDTWTSMGAFKDYIEEGGEGTKGLVGAAGVAGKIANGYAGDILQIRNSSDWYHTYIIVKATGTSGSRTNADYYICAHTTNRKNETLKSVVGESQKNLRLLTISGSYY